MIRKPNSLLRSIVGLGGVGACALLAAPHSMHVAAPSPAVPAARALLAATSYRQFSVVHVSTAGSTVVSSVKLTLDLVRRGKSVRTYIQENVDGTVIELRRPSRRTRWDIHPRHEHHYLESLDRSQPDHPRDAGIMSAGTAVDADPHWS